MPRYSYECSACGHSFERVEGWDAPVQQPCPAECPDGRAGRATARRILMAPAIVFKGSGFYKTDSRASASGVTSRNGRDGASEPASEEHGAPAEAPAEAPADGPAKKPSDAPVKAAATSPAGKASGSKPGRSPRPKSRS